MSVTFMQRQPQCGGILLGLLLVIPTNGEPKCEIY